jgi:hypothetical protein
LQAANELGTVPQITSGQEDAFRFLFNAHLPMLIQLNGGVIGDWDPETWRARHAHHEVVVSIISSKRKQSSEKKMKLATFLDHFMNSKRTEDVKLSVRQLIEQ